jgi:hypothetical protein
MSASMAATPQPITPTTNFLQPFTAQQQAANNNASQLLRQVYGKKFQQQINFGSSSFTPVFGQSLVVNIPLTPVGLITKFHVLVSTVITNPSGGSTLTRAPFGPWNSLSLVQYTDPAYNTRISTTGYHLAAVTARRHRRVPGAAFTTDTPSAFGSVMNPIAAPATIAANATGTVNCVYEIPLAFGQNTLKGAVFAGAVFATQSLQLTFNPNFCQASTDGLGAAYTGAGTGVNAPTYATTIQVFYEFWDQFPLDLLSALSPDLSTIYELKQTAFTNLLAANDNYIRFNNLRQFMSAFVAYDNGGVQNPGTDINYFLLQSANQTQLKRWVPNLLSYQTRNKLGDDMPTGTYMFDFSDAPIITAAEGNTVLSVNPITVGSGATLFVGWEDLAINSVLATATSLSGNAGVG